MPQDHTIGRIDMGSNFIFAFKNVFRNKRRSLLTATSIFTGAVVISIMIGITNGLIDNFVSNYVDYQTGDLKITTRDYVRYEKYLPVDETMTGSESLAASVRKIPGVDSVEERMRFGILLGNDRDTVPAFGLGADLLSPRLDLKKKIISGSLENKGLYIGHGLAEKLHLKIGDEILLAAKTTSGGLNGIKARVNGILSFGVGLFDRKFFFLDISEAKKLLKMQGMDTELLVFAKRGYPVSAIKGKISGMLPEGGEEVVRDLQTQLGSMYNFIPIYRYIIYFFELMIILLASFVIISTMMQAVFERMREIGTLKAMGMTDGEIFYSYTFEGAIIGMIGAIPGGIIGYLLVLRMSANGLTLEQFRNVDLPFNFVLYPFIGPEVLFISIIMAVLMSGLAAMIPARNASSLMPAEALRKL
jgi:putative ABC transport system permease protein